MRIRVLMADDHPVFRKGLRALIEKQPDMVVEGDVGDGRQAVDMARERGPDVVLMDVSMPGLNGIEATRQIHSACPSSKVLCLSMHTEDRFVAAMLDAGASGYVLKECETDELIRAIRAVAANQTYLSAEIAGDVVREYLRHHRKHGGRPLDALTPREREVLQLVAEGSSARQIASCLGVSVKTIHTHRENIMHKLNVHNSAELTKYALREGLVSA